MKNLSKILAFVIALAVALFPAMPGLAAEQSTAPLESHIIVTNNAGIPDTIKIVNLQAGDIVKVYTDADRANLLVQKTSYSKTATLTTELEHGSGTIYVSVTSRGKTESDPTQKSYDEEPQSASPDVGNIIVTNNAGKQDTVKVTGLKSGDLVIIYDAASSQLAQGRVASGATSVIIKYPQLGAGGGKINVSVTSKGMQESIPTEKPFDPEATSDAPNDITVVNNAGQPDLVTVAGLSSGAVVKVYPDDISANPLGKATVASGASSVTVRINQLGTDAGFVYVSVTSPGAAESGRTPKDYDAEAKSIAPDEGAILINNYAGASDTITVTGAGGDLIKVYADAGFGTLLGQATVAKGTANINIAQLGEAAGTVYVTVTNPGKGQSDPTPKGYDAEAKSTQLLADAITVVNNAGNPDTVTVSGGEGDLIKVYADAVFGTLLGQATVAKGTITANINIAQLGKAAGTVYVTVTNPGKGQSDPTHKGYDAEPQSDAPDAANIIVVNNAGTPDTVTVSGGEGDRIKVYADAGLGTLLGQATVAKGAASATVSVRQLPDTGKIYVTVTSTNKCESDGTEITYGDEIESPAPDAADITVTNNAGIPDTVRVDYLDPGDAIKVYATATAARIWGQATVAKGASSVTINFRQLGGAGGTIYVSLCKSGMLESDRTETTFDPEKKSSAPGVNDITITNNAGIPSQVTVANLQPGDIVSVYEDAKLVTLLGQATVAQGAVSVSVSIKDLFAAGGNVFITLTRPGCLESDAVEVNYGAQAESDRLEPDNILIINNPGTDLIIVYGLNPGDIIKVYPDASTAKPLATATVAAKQSQVIITVSQLGADGGTVFLTNTSAGSLESNRIEKSFASE